MATDVPTVTPFDQAAYEEVNSLDGESTLERTNHALFIVGSIGTVGIIGTTLALGWLWFHLSV